jgi:hypothetical protein
MNVIERLTAARPAHLDPAVETDQATRGAELARAMAAPRTPRTTRTAGEIRSGEMKRRIVRPLWGLGVVGAAAVTAVTLAVTGSGGGAAPGSPGISASAAPTTMDARTVLLAAAHQATGSPVETGAYWHSTRLDRSYQRIGDYTVVEENRFEDWTPTGTGKDKERWSRQQYLGTRPATPADVAAWKRAGAPATFEVQHYPGPRAKLFAPEVLRTGPGKPSTSHTPLIDGDKVFSLGENVTMKDLRALPADPARLKTVLLRSYKGHGTEASSVPMSAETWLFTVTRGLITDMPVTPRVRGAAFRMLADLKTVRAVGTVKDAQGREGTAVAVTEDTKAAGLLQHRLIISSAGEALGQETVALRPAGTTAGLPAGSVESSSTVSSDWTDSVPR